MEPIVEDGEYRFEVRVGKDGSNDQTNFGTKIGGSNKPFKCILTGAPMPFAKLREQAKNGEMGQTPLAIVCEGKRGRIYFSPNRIDQSIAESAIPDWRPKVDLPPKALGFRVQEYGMTTWDKLFTDRQLVALTTFSDLVGEARERVAKDAFTAWEQGNTERGIVVEPDLDAMQKPLEEGGKSHQAYADAVAVYLGFSLGRSTDFNNQCVGWRAGNEKIMNLFSRQAIPMTWDFAEANILANVVGGFETHFKYQTKCFRFLPANRNGYSTQANASSQFKLVEPIISSDPPYYDNIGYADLSDFFYVWFRRSLKEIVPNSVSGILVPKDEELIASPYRHGGKTEAENFFLSGMREVMNRWAESTCVEFPITIYYAFKQSEIKSEGIASTGWATFLEAMIDSGLSVVRTWPLRTEQSTRVLSLGTAALASSVVLVCRKRNPNAPMATRREFVQLLQQELPDKLATLLNSNIAPVDLPQSAIGPGMAIYSRFSKVVEADGNAMSVTTALQLINKAVDESLSDQESEMDEWTRFAITWFSQYGYESGPYGDAEQIANARDVAVDGVAAAGIIESGSGKVRIYRPGELPDDWDPETDNRLTIWEIVHHLIRLIESEGEEAAARILARIGGLSHDSRKLCYQLFNLCEQNKWAEEASAYNTLITSWPELAKLAEDQRGEVLEQGELI